MALAERLDMAVANVDAEPSTVVLSLLGGAARHDGRRRGLKVDSGDSLRSDEDELKFFLSLGSSREGAQVRGETGANGLLGTPAPHLNPTLDRGEEIRCALGPPPLIIMGSLTFSETQLSRSKPAEDPPHGGRGGVVAGPRA